MDKQPCEDEIKTNSKKLVKRFMIAGIFALALIILAGAGIALLSYEAGSSVNPDMLTVKDVTKTLKQAGVKLASAYGVSPAEYKMGQTKPSVYQIKELDGVLFIYQFSSIGERNTTYYEWEEERRRPMKKALTAMTAGTINN